MTAWHTQADISSDGRDKMRRKITTFLIQTVAIAILYFVLTFVAYYFQLASSINFQLRISDALTVLPYYTPAAIPGLFIGCLLANGAMNLPTPDIIFGSLANLVAAAASYLIRKKKFMVPIPPILIISFAIPAVYTFLLGFDEQPFWRSVVMVGLGEAVTCGLFGIALMLGLEDYKDKLFPKYTSDGKKISSEKEKTEITGER